MSPPEEQLQAEHFARIRRLLRPLPRRTNLHRYPVLKWFAASARKRRYLWSFKEDDTTPSFYAGAVLAMLPLYGVQLPLSLAFALVLRCNLPIVAALLFITNPLTVAPAYLTTYYVGDVILEAAGWVHEVSAEEAVAAAQQGVALFGRGYVALTAGGLVLGLFAGGIAHVLYRLLVPRAVSAYTKRRDARLRAQRDKAKTHGAVISPANSSSEAKALAPSAQDQP